MHKNAIVVNTGPIIALSAALGSLEILKNLYDDIYVTFEVCQEIAVFGYGKFESDIFINSDFITKISEKNNTSDFLLNSLDIGEATVILKFIMEFKKRRLKPRMHANYRGFLIIDISLFVYDNGCIKID